MHNNIIMHDIAGATQPKLRGDSVRYSSGGNSDAC